MRRNEIQSDPQNAQTFGDRRASATELAMCLLRAAQVVRSAMNEFLNEFELNDVRFLVIKELEACWPNGCTQAELADRLRLSESNICTLVERMRQDGWVYRHRDKHDRRKRLLLPTEKARETLASVQAQHELKLRRVFGALSDDELAQTVGLLQLLTGSVETGRRGLQDQAESQSPPAAQSVQPALPEIPSNPSPALQRSSPETPASAGSGRKLFIHRPHGEQTEDRSSEQMEPGQTSRLGSPAWPQLEIHRPTDV